MIQVDVVVMLKERVSNHVSEMQGNKELGHFGTKTTAPSVEGIITVPFELEWLQLTKKQ